MFEIVNLKSALTFRVVIEDRECAFTTKTFRGKNIGRGNIPESREHVPYDVYAIVVESTHPW